MSAVASGFFGKIPARGDFVRSGLPGGFIAAWDAWLQDVIPVSRELLGEDWLPAWMEAPIWRFSLDRGICGADPVLGVWMPSVDRAGRHFPLTLAAVVPGARMGDLAEYGTDWLETAERAGLEAVMSDVLPERLASLLDAAPSPLHIGRGEEIADHGFPVGAGNGMDAHEPSLSRGDGEAGRMSRWWTDGAPRVAACSLATPGMPDGATFAAMLDDRLSGAGQ